MAQKGYTPNAGCISASFIILIVLTILVIVGLILGMVFWLVPMMGLSSYNPGAVMIVGLFGGVLFFMVGALILSKFVVQIPPPMANDTRQQTANNEEKPDTNA